MEKKLFLFFKNNVSVYFLFFNLEKKKENLAFLFLFLFQFKIIWILFLALGIFVSETNVFFSFIIQEKDFNLKVSIALDVKDADASL